MTNSNNVNNCIALNEVSAKDGDQKVLRADMQKNAATHRIIGKFCNVLANSRVDICLTAHVMATKRAHIQKRISIFTFKSKPPVSYKAPGDRTSLCGKEAVDSIISVHIAGQSHTFGRRLIDK